MLFRCAWFPCVETCGIGGFRIHKHYHRTKQIESSGHRILCWSLKISGFGTKNSAPSTESLAPRRDGTKPLLTSYQKLYPNCWRNSTEEVLHIWSCAVSPKKCEGDEKTEKNDPRMTSGAMWCWRPPQSDAENKHTTKSQTKHRKIRFEHKNNLK